MPRARVQGSSSSHLKGPFSPTLKEPMTSKTTTKKPRKLPVKWGVAHKACQNADEREDLEEAIRLGWQPDELAEFARIYWHAPGLDHATPSAYRLAITFARGSIGSDFLTRFRELGGIPAPARAKATLYSKRRKEKLALQYNRDWEGHTDEFREEVAQKAREDRHLSPGAYIGPRWWKIACNKHYELTED
jgi:hypothetical protein